MIIAEVLKFAESKSRGEKSDTGLPFAMTKHIVCCLDLLNANYDGLPAEAAQYAAKFQLFKTLHATLIDDSFDQRVSLFTLDALFRGIICCQS